MTVITPARDMAVYIGATMASVLAQTLVDFEYLVVDNGSTDDTRRIAEQIAAGDDRVRVLVETRPGSAAARNRGLAEARGRYLAFVDADDVWLPDKLARQVAELDALPESYSGVFCRSVCIDANDNELFTYRAPVGTYDLGSFRAWFYPAGNGSSFLVRRRAVEGVGGFDERLDNLVDVEWLHRLLRDSDAPFLLGTGDVLVRYRLHAGSVSTRTDARMSAMEVVVGRYAPDGDPLAWFRPALMAYRCGRPVEGRRWARRARRYGWHRLLRCPDGRRLLAWQILNRLGPAVAGRRAGDHPPALR